jgi:hypothetical protein
MRAQGCPKERVAPGPFIFFDLLDYFLGLSGCTFRIAPGFFECLAQVGLRLPPLYLCVDSSKNIDE